MDENARPRSPPPLLYEAAATRPTVDLGQGSLETPVPERSTAGAGSAINAQLFLQVN